MKKQVCKNSEPDVIEVPAKSPDQWRCRNCGSLAVQQRAWVNVNTGEVESFIDGGRDDYWCEACEQHGYPVRGSELNFHAL